MLSKEEFVAQNDLISMLKERIEAISDGIARGAKQTGGWATSRGAKQTGGWATSASHGGTKIGSTSGDQSQVYQSMHSHSKFL